MRQAVLGSGLAHVALIAVLFIVRQNAPLIIPGADVVQVALVDPSATLSLPARSAPARPERRERGSVTPDEEAGVRLEKPRERERERAREPKKDETPEPAPETPAPAAPALPFAAVGNAGLRGAVSVDAANFEFAYYLALVRNRVGQNWSPPAGLVPAGKPLRSVVYFRIRRDGAIAGVRLESSSAQTFFDRTALRAVLISDPMPPLPIGFDGSDLGVHFGFEYESP